MTGDGGINRHTVRVQETPARFATGNAWFFTCFHSLNGFPSAQAVSAKVSSLLSDPHLHPLRPGQHGLEPLGVLLWYPSSSLDDFLVDWQF